MLSQQLDEKRVAKEEQRKQRERDSEQAKEKEKQDKEEDDRHVELQRKKQKDTAAQLERQAQEQRHQQRRGLYTMTTEERLMNADLLARARTHKNRTQRGCTLSSG